MYDHYNLTFNDFTSKEAYLKLQNHFYVYDVDVFPEDDGEGLLKKIIEGTFVISYIKRNPLTEDQIRVKKDFFSDFLLPKIIKLYSDYVLFFQREVEDRTILEASRKELFAKGHLKKLYKIYVPINKAEYLSEEIKLLLLNQLERIKQGLSNNQILINYRGLDKIIIDMKQIDVLTLFTLLRNKGIVKNIYDNELGVLIDKNFRCSNNRVDLDLKNSSKKLGEIKNGSRTVKKSIERLKKLFMEEDLYNLITTGSKSSTLFLF